MKNKSVTHQTGLLTVYFPYKTLNTFLQTLIRQVVITKVYQSFMISLVLELLGDISEGGPCCIATPKAIKFTFMGL